MLVHACTNFQFPRSPSSAADITVGEGGHKQIKTPPSVKNAFKGK